MAHSRAACWISCLPRSRSKRQRLHPLQPQSTARLGEQVLGAAASSRVAKHSSRSSSLGSSDSSSRWRRRGRQRCGPMLPLMGLMRT